MVLSQAHFLFHKDNSAELGKVVFDIETVFLALDDCVAARDGNVVDAHFGLVAAAQLELRLRVRNCQHVNVARRVFVQGHRL